MDAPVWQLKKQMCEIGQRIWQKGFCAGNEGNHSIRIGDDRYLCTPTGVSKGMLEPEDILTINGQAEAVERNRKGRKPTSEIKVHLAIYQARDDIKAVIHSHPPHATAFAIAGIPMPEAIHPEAEVFLGKVKTAKYATPSTYDLPNSLIPLIDADTSTLLMGNHGSVSFSHSLVDAYYRLEILDAYARILLLVKQLGRINTLNDSQMRELLEVKQAFGLHDPRLSCATDGCVGEDNDAFLATFGIRPAGASADRDGGAVAASEPSGAVDQEQFEQMVQTITDQIMAAAG